MQKYYITEDDHDNIEYAIDTIENTFNLKEIDTISIMSNMETVKFMAKAKMLGAHIVNISEHIDIVYMSNTNKLIIVSDMQLALKDNGDFACVTNLPVKTFDVRGLDFSEVDKIGGAFWIDAENINISGINLSKLKTLRRTFSHQTRIKNIDMSNVDLSGLNPDYATAVSDIFIHQKDKKLTFGLTVDITGLKMHNKDRLYCAFKSLECSEDSRAKNIYSNVNIIGYTPENTDVEKYYNFLLGKNAASVVEINSKSTKVIKVPREDAIIKFGHLYTKDRLNFIVLSRTLIPVDTSSSNTVLLSDSRSFYWVLVIHPNMLNEIKRNAPLKLSRLSEIFNGFDISSLTSYEAIRLVSKANDFGKVISDIDCGDISHDTIVGKMEPHKPSVGDVHIDKYTLYVTNHVFYSVYLGQIPVEQPLNGLTKLHASLLIDANAEPDFVQHMKDTKTLELDKLKLSDKVDYIRRLRLTTTMPYTLPEFEFKLNNLPENYDALKAFLEFWETKKPLTLEKDGMIIEYTAKDSEIFIKNFEEMDWTDQVGKDADWDEENETPEQKEKRIARYNERKNKFITELKRLQVLAEDIMTEKCQYSIWDCINYKNGKFTDTHKVVSASRVTPVRNAYDYIQTTKIGLMLNKKSDIRLTLEIDEYTSTSVPVFDKDGIMHRTDETKKINKSEVIPGGVYTTETGTMFMYVGFKPEAPMSYSYFHTYFRVTDKTLQEIQKLTKSSELADWLRKHGKVTVSTCKKPREFWKKVCQCITEYDIPEAEMADNIYEYMYNK